VGFEEIGKGVETGRHWIYDDMGCFVEEQAGLLVVGKVVREAKHSSIGVPTHRSQVIY
jgi:hypothetical protein